MLLGAGPGGPWGIRPIFSGFSLTTAPAYWRPKGRKVARLAGVGSMGDPKRRRPSPPGPPEDAGPDGPGERDGSRNEPPRCRPPAPSLRASYSAAARRIPSHAWMGSFLGRRPLRGPAHGRKWSLASQRRRGRLFQLCHLFGSTPGIPGNRGPSGRAKASSACLTGSSTIGHPSSVVPPGRPRVSFDHPTDRGRPMNLVRCPPPSHRA